VIVQLSDELAVVVSIAVWVAVGLFTGLVGHALPLSWLDHDTWLTRPRRFERDGRSYQRWLRIRAWKDRVPEQGALFPGGYSKRHLGGRDTPQLQRFAAETRRAELVHWGNLAAGPWFLIWCVPWLGAVMIAFGVVAHLPFILIQRYNRAGIERILARRDRVRR
jgi:glycosyl-4,4'-diaponeurosporenoate acyltransferase